MQEPAMTDTVRFASRILEVGGPEMGRLRDANPLLDDPLALRARLAEDGYLLVRGLLDPAEVLAARREVLQVQADHGVLLPGSDPMDAIANPTPPPNLPNLSHGSIATRGPRFLQLHEGARVMRFFSHFFGEPSRTFDFKWLRVMGSGGSSPGHFDNSYMGRGSAKVLTLWTPLGDCGFHQGPLTIIPGTHRLPAYARLRETLGLMDVDRDRVRGNFAEDPFEFTRRFGGQWATADFRSGDALIFGMFTLHASAENTSGRIRLSSDTRFQPASEPADERWVGEQPKAHYAWFQGEGVSMTQKRQEWQL
jgi:hypothetical protein